MNKTKKTRKPGRAVLLEEQEDSGHEIDQVVAVKEVSKIPNTNTNNRLKLLLKSLKAVKSGDFSVRLPIVGDGVLGAIFKAFNDIVGINERLANKIVRKSRVIGEENKLTERQQAEDVLKSSEVKYRRLFETAQDGILILDADTGKITDVNPFLTDMLGYSSEELLGKQLWEIGPFKDIEASQGAFQTLRSRGYVRYEHLPLENKSGQRIAVEFVSNVYSVNGKRVIQCNIRDITNREQVEETLRESEERYRDLYSNAPIAYFSVGTDGFIKESNKATRQLFGHSEEELRKMPVLGLYAEESKSKAKSVLDKRFKQGLDIVNEEMAYQRKDGKKVYGLLSVSLVKDKNSRVVASRSMVRDITERKQAEEKLAESEAKYRRLFETAQDAILILDGATGRIIDANPFIKDLLGYSMEELRGKNLWEIGKAMDVLASKLSYKQLHKEGYVRYEHLPLVARDGRVVAVEVVANAYQVGHQRIIQCNIRDITARKREEEARERLTQQLQAKVSELETFSYGIAHDLRSPLVSIEGFNRLLREDMQNQKVENVKEDIRLLETSVRKMQGFLDSTLDYSRSGQLIKRTEDVSFGKIVEEAVAEFDEEALSIGGVISRAKIFPKVYADRMRIKEVLTNLVKNSIKYRDKTVPLKIEIGHYRSGKEVVFFVRDNGTGIDANEVGKIFDLFYRGTADGEGSGIGLAVVKKIIEAHGGRIWVREGQTEKGTTICFTLPEQGGTNKGDNDG
jgi:PAS domain S-box-containing protein